MNKLTFKIINYSDVVTNSSTLIHIATAPFYRRKPMKFVATNFKGIHIHFTFYEYCKLQENSKKYLERHTNTSSDSVGGGGGAPQIKTLKLMKM